MHVDCKSSFDEELLLHSGTRLQKSHSESLNDVEPVTAWIYKMSNKIYLNLVLASTTYQI